MNRRQSSSGRSHGAFVCDLRDQEMAFDGARFSGAEALVLALIVDGRFVRELGVLVDRLATDSHE